MVVAGTVPILKRERAKLVTSWTKMNNNWKKWQKSASDRRSHGKISKERLKNASKRRNLNGAAALWASKRNSVRKQIAQIDKRLKELGVDTSGMAAPWTDEANFEYLD